MMPKFAVAPAVAFYLLYPLGLVVFAGLPALATRNWRFATTRGALLGCIAFATYDLTNLATLRGWSTVVTLADIGWGVTLSATATTVSYLIVKATLAS